MLDKEEKGRDYVLALEAKLKRMEAYFDALNITVFAVDKDL